MATVSVSHGLTADEYALLPDIDGVSDELIEAERVFSPMPKLAHVGAGSVPGPDLMIVRENDVQRAVKSVRVHTLEPEAVVIYAGTGEMTVPFRCALGDLFSVLGQD